MSGYHAKNFTEESSNEIALDEFRKLSKRGRGGLGVYSKLCAGSAQNDSNFLMKGEGRIYIQNCVQEVPKMMVIAHICKARDNFLYFRFTI